MPGHVKLLALRYISLVNHHGADFAIRQRASSLEFVGPHMLSLFPGHISFEREIEITNSKCENGYQGGD